MFWNADWVCTWSSKIKEGAPIPEPNGGKAIGIDVWIKEFYSDSNGKKKIKRREPIENVSN